MKEAKKMWSKVYIYFILMISVSIAGEFKFFPITTVDVRISLATPVFLAFLLFSKKIKPVHAGVLVGISVVIFRTCLASLNTEHLNWTNELLFHAPVFSYYLVYGLFFYLFKVRSFYHQPLVIALIGMVLENIATITEVSFTYNFSSDWITLNALLKIFIISFFRSFFVLGFFNFLLLRESNATESLQRKKNEEMLVLVSNLFVEMVQVKKSMRCSEDTTQACYQLYRKLMDDNNQYAKEALHIAGEIHEIKKDHQRIYSGLSKLKDEELSIDLMKIEEIINIVIGSNREYAKTLNKSINFKVDIFGEHPQYNSFILLSLISNLVTNSVEAIKVTGDIAILVERSEENISFQIKDNGPGIPLANQALVFEPGYTTKYDVAGVASTGIGLSHLKEVIESLNGEIQLHSNQKRQNTAFTIQLPIKNINDIR